MMRITRLLKFLALPMFTGILLILTLPPYNIEFFTWVSLIPLLIFLKKEQGAWVAILGSGISGFIYHLFGVFRSLESLNTWWWLGTTGFITENRKALFFSFLIAFAIYAGGIFFATFGLVFRKLRSSNWDILILPASWALLEYLREPLVLNFTWGELGYGLHNNSTLLQIARPFGVYGLSFLIVFVNMAVYRILIGAISRRPAQNIPVWQVLKKYSLGVAKSFHAYALIIVLLVTILYGKNTIAVSARSQSGDSLRVAVVHSGHTTEELTKKEGASDLASLLEEALKGNPDIAVLPENAFPFIVIDRTSRLPIGYENPYFEIRPLFDRLRKLSSAHPATSILIGLHTTNGEKRYNSLVVLEGGTVRDIYNKRALFPLTEESPKWLGWPIAEPIERGATNDSYLPAAHGIPFTTLICSEVILPRLAKSRTARFIVNMGNDSMFDNPAVGEQNLIMAKMRAVENHRFVLRATKHGTSAIIDPSGEVVTEWQGASGHVITGTIYY